MTNLIISISAILLIALIFKKHKRGKTHASVEMHALSAPEESENEKNPPAGNHNVAPSGRINCLGRPCLGTASSLSLTEPRLGLPADISEVNRLYRIADMHFSRGAFEEAEKWFIKVLASDSDHPEVLNKLGVIYLQQGNPRRAEIIYRKLLSITQKEPVYYCNYGRCLYNQKRPQEAIEAYENAIKLDATKPTRFVSLGQIYYEQKDYAKALACFTKALDLDPQNLEYLNIIVDLAELTGDAERLHRSLKKIVELDPYNENAKSKLANLDLLKG